MEINKFLDIKMINHKDVIIVNFVINTSVPTSLQWIITLDDIKKCLDELKNANIKFGFIFDIRKVGFVSLNYIKEFTKLMENYGPLLEENLYGTSAIAEGMIIKYLFDAINTFYKTKKPLKIVNNSIDASKFIEENVF